MKKLVLKKDVVARINGGEMNQLKGGGTQTSVFACSQQSNCDPSICDFTCWNTCDDDTCVNTCANTCANTCYNTCKDTCIGNLTMGAHTCIYSCDIQCGGY